MIAWGISWTNAKVLGNFGDRSNIIFLRFLFATSAMVPIMLYRKIPLTINREMGKNTAIAALMFSGYNWLFFKATHTGFAGAGGVLVTTLNPIFTFGLTVLISRRKINFRELLGLLLGFSGGLIILKIWAIDSHLLVASGNIYFLAGSLFYAVITVFVSKKQTGVSSFTFIFWMYLFSTFYLIPFVNFHSFTSLFITDLIFWGNLFMVSVGAMSFGTSVFIYSTKTLGPEKTSVFIFTVPVSALLTSMVFLHEPLDIFVISGGALSIIAVYLINSKTLQ